VLPTRRLAALVQELPLGGSPRLERLRATIGRRTQPLTLALRRVVLPAVGDALLAVALGGPRLAPRHPGAPVPGADALFRRPDAIPERGIAELREVAGGRSLHRIIWHSDAAGRLSFSSGHLAELAGPGFAPRNGDTPALLLARGIRECGQSLEAALGSQDTFTGLELLWPVDAGAAALEVTLSGTPVLDAERAFAGYRGFGIVRLEALVPIEPPPAPPAEAAVEDDPEPEPSQLEEDVAAATVASEEEAGSSESPAEEDFGASVANVSEDQPAAAIEPEPTSPVPDQPEPATAPDPAPAADLTPAAAALPDKVVPLRPSAPRVSEPPGLSRAERQAFREIARALGARVEDAEPAATDPASAAPAPAATAATPDEADVALEPAPGDVVAQPEAATEETAPVETVGAPAAVEVAREAPAYMAMDDDPSPPAPVPPVPEMPGMGLQTAMLLDRLPIGVMVSRGDVPILMNRTLLDLLGYEDEDAFHAEGGIERLFGDALQGGEAQGDSTNVNLHTRSGESVPVDARLQTIAWDGLPATLMSFRRAVEADTAARTRHIERDVARREAENRELRAILDTATDGVVVLDETGRIVSINRAGEALFGYDQQEVAGETFISLFAPDSHATAMDYLEGLKSNGVASLLNDGREVIGRVRQGGRIPLFMTLGAVSEHPERKFCAVLRDITPWKKAESELLEAKKAAETASAQKSDFLAKISHEIRTPLSAIIGFAEVMIEERFGPVGNERYLEYLRDIHASGGHVISLVNDLLDLSKIEAGRFDLTFISVDVNEVVSRCVAMMQPQAATGRVVLRSSLSPRVPAVVADERSLRQIVLNILSNAIKFTDPGGQVIVSTAFTDRGEVAVRVRDTGIGMTEKEIETALEPFRQVATARRAGGTGLGLPLTKALVEANRASLSIRSAKDAGTLVEVTFPTTRVLAE
jgi:PAS domain S-box-containing protein